MIVRSAFLEGDVLPESRAAFERIMAHDVMRAVAAYPGILKFRLRRPAEPSNDGGPGIYMAFDLYFEDIDSMRAALASDTRRHVRALVESALRMFEGRMYHITFEEAA